MTLKSALIGSTSALAVSCMVGASAFAAEPIPMPERTLSGVFDLHAGYNWLTGDFEDGTNTSGTGSSDDGSGFQLGGAAYVDIPFNPNLSLQLDLEADAGFPNPNSTDTDQSDNYGGGVVSAAHLNYRDMDRYLFGVFAGGGAANVVDSGTTGGNYSLYFIGVEGQYYFGNSTLYGQVGYLDSDQYDNTTNHALQDAFFLRLVGRHFFNQGHTKLEGEITYTEGTQSTSDDADVFGWGVEIDHQMHMWSNNDGLFSVFARYEGRNFNESNGGTDEYSDHQFTVGLSFAFNQSTLQSSAITGVALDLPDFSRLVAGTTKLD